jgi:hypothetical protein
MWSGRPLGPTAGPTSSPTARTCRPSSEIGRPTRPPVPKGRRVSNGPQATMSPAIPCFGAALIRPPVAPVPPGRGVRRRKTPRGNAPGGLKPTMRRCRPPANARRRPSARRNMRSGLASSAASPKASGALLCARVATAAWRVRTSSPCSRPWPCMWSGGSLGSKVSAWKSAGGSRDTLPDLRPLPYHATRCFVKAT